MYKFNKKKKIKTKKVKRKSEEKNFSWKRFVFYFFCLLFFLLIIYIFLFSNLVEIKNINIKNNNEVSSDSITQKIKDKLQGNNFLYIAKNNFFLVSEKDIKNDIFNNFPKIRNVEIKKIFPNSIEISVSEYDLIPIMCIESQDGQCFILDRNGIILEDADFNNSKLINNKVVIIIDKNKNDIVEMGKEFISKEKLNNIIFLGEELTYTLNSKINQPYFIPARGANEVTFEVGEGWYLQVDTINNPKITLKVLELFFQKGIKEEIRRHDLEYVDARINEKIFYKYNNKKKKLF